MIASGQDATCSGLGGNIGSPVSGAGGVVTYWRGGAGPQSGVSNIMSQNVTGTPADCGTLIPSAANVQPGLGVSASGGVAYRVTFNDPATGGNYAIYAPVGVIATTLPVAVGERQFTSFGAPAFNGSTVAFAALAGRPTKLIGTATAIR